MSENDPLQRGLAALERARPLYKAGKSREAAALYKEALACFTAALQAANLSAASRTMIEREITLYRNRIDEIEGVKQLDDSSWEDLLPEAPTTKPVMSSQESKPRKSRPADGAVASTIEAEEKAKLLLQAAISLDEKGESSAWRVPGAKALAADAYTDAAEAFISAKRLAADSQKAKVHERLCEQAIVRAEELKGVAKATPSPAARRPTPAKTPTRGERKAPPPRSPTRPAEGGLTDEEVHVLKASSIVNGKLFMPWIDDDLQEAFSYPKPWTDPDGLLSLSGDQHKKLQRWSRPSEYMPGEPKMIAKVNPYSIRQDLITDCSFVASLCIASAFERRFHKQLITGIIYPQNNRRMPIYNPAGKYLVKLTVNGVARKVVVDDLLPTGERGRLLCSGSTDKTELWVSIIEKAYLKVNGGYDFPGSNSGIDLFALTGWLPEQIFFEEHRESKAREKQSRRPQPLDNYEPAERVWERLLSAHEFGDCLITVATSEIGEEDADRLGLVPSHAYAVLDVKEIEGTRLLQVKNPWSRRRWRGPYSVDDSQRWTPALKRAVKYDVENAQLQDNGVFWIDFASIFRYFKNVFMNWNPALFTFRSVLHARWPQNLGPKNDTYNLGLNPQYTLKVRNSSGAGASGAGSKKAAAAGGAAAAANATRSPTVWVLLTRHVTELETDAQTGDFLTMHVYDGTNGKRVYYPDTPMFRGIYTNNPHTLIRFDLPASSAGEMAYTLVVSQYEKKREVRYTLNVYCTSSFRLFATPVEPKHRHEISGAWDAQSAGGAVGRAMFFTNPQYAMVLTHPETLVHVQVAAYKDYQINASVVSDGGSRVDSFPREQEALTTGPYRSGFCYAEGILKAGTYTIVVSTYKPGQVGTFKMKLATSSPIRPPSRIPAEGEGLPKQVVMGRWREEDGSAAGCSNFGRYLENPRYALSVSSKTVLVMRIAVPEGSGPYPAGRPAVNVSVFAAGGDEHEATAGASPSGKFALNPRCKPTSSLALASSNKGVYVDSSGGAASEAVTLEPGEYVAVVSAFTQQEADYVLTVYAGPGLAKVQRVA